MFNRQLMPLTTNIAESSNITQQRNSSSNISLHNLTVALNLTIQGKIKVEQLKQYLAAGYFAAGSMKPKIEAAIEFVEKTGNLAIITSLSNANKLADGVGTIIYN